MKGWAFVFLVLASFIFIGSAPAQTTKTCAGDGSSTSLGCGLVGWWKLNETPSTLLLANSNYYVADSSGQGNNGKLVNFTNAGTWPTQWYIPGKVGYNQNLLDANGNITNGALNFGQLSNVGFWNSGQTDFLGVSRRYFALYMPLY